MIGSVVVLSESMEMHAEWSGILMIDVKKLKSENLEFSFIFTFLLKLNIIDV